MFLAVPLFGCGCCEARRVVEIDVWNRAERYGGCDWLTTVAEITFGGVRQCVSTSPTRADIRCRHSVGTCCHLPLISALRRIGALF